MRQVPASYGARADRGRAGEGLDEGPGLLVAVWRQKLIALCVVMILTILGLLAGLVLPKTYTARTVMTLTDYRLGLDVPEVAPTPQDALRYAANQARLAGADEVLAAAAKTLATDFKTMESSVHVTTIDDGAALKVAASASGRASAQERADAVADAYMALRTNQVIVERNLQVDNIDQQIASIDTAIQTLEGLPNTTAREDQIRQQAELKSTLFSQRGRVESRAASFGIDGSGVDYVEKARRPPAPDTPGPLATGAAGGLLGVILATALSWLLTVRSTRSESDEDISRILGAPVLGSLPPDADEIELVRELAAGPYTFVAAAVDELRPSAILLTSPWPSPATAAAAASLAGALAGRHQRVLLVDASADEHFLPAMLDADPPMGLSRVALAEAGIRDVTVPINGFGGEVELASLGPESERSVVSRHRAALLDRIRVRFEIVVFDGAGILGRSDVATVAGLADSVIVVAPLGVDLNELQDVRNRLELLGLSVNGCIVVDEQRTARGVRRPASLFG